VSPDGDEAGWRQGLDEGGDSLFAGLPHPQDRADYPTLTYEVTGRIARITFNRPSHGNAITPDTPLDLAHAVERADLDPRVHVVVVSGRGSGFCGGYDLGLFAEADMAGAAASDEHGQPRAGTVLDPVAQARNHDPSRVWDPTVDFAMMSRFNRGFAGMWAHRLGDQRAKRLLFTGDAITGAEAAEWGLAVEAPAPDELDARTEVLLERIAAMPLNQLIMAKLALNSALLAQGVATSTMVSTVFDGVARHTREGHSFAARAAEAGFRQAVRERDEPFGDAGRTVHRG
jgi:enoyl-CoA hydratase